MQLTPTTTTPSPFSTGNPYLKRILHSWERKKKLAASDGNNGYGVNGDLVMNVVRQMWRLIWNIQPADAYSTDSRSAVVPRFVGGGAAAAAATGVSSKAVVLVSASEGCREKQMVPIVSGMSGGEGATESILVLHPDAIATRHKELCEFFERMDTSGHVKRDPMCDALKREFKLHVSLFLSEKDALPVPLPKFSVQYV